MDKIYRAGDPFLVTPKMEKLLNEPDYLFGNSPFKAGMRGVVFAQRLDREMGYLCIEWETPTATGSDRTNVHMFEKIGIVFEHPTFEKIPIMEAELHLLSPMELVERGLREQGLTGLESGRILDKVTTAMSKYEIVFYIP